MFFYFQRFYFALLIFFGMSAVTHAEVVGLSAGEFRVDEGGAATYNIPINVPAGRAGVTPQLSLNYSSNNVMSGPVGTGWSMGGVSAISRCPQAPIYDSAITGVNFTSSDRFCLDGQRLILTSGTYGAPYSTYIKAADDFSEITAMGGTQSTGPMYFEVKTKAGETFYYGNPSLTGLVSTDQTDAFVEPSNKTGLAKTWAVKVITDVKNNYILFNYLNDKSAGSFYLDSIQYSARLGDASAPNRVQFVYEDYNKGFFGYQAGSYARHNKLLKRVDSSVDGTIYRSYFLEYENSNFIEERTLLTSAQECPDNDADKSNCLPKTTFAWQRPNLASSSTTYVCDVEDNPNIPEFCYDKPISTNYVPFPTSKTLATGAANAATSQVFDINGDGYQDIIYVSGSYWYVKLGPSYGTAQAMATQGVSKKEYALNIDYNGDGVRDLLVANSVTSNWYAMSFQSSEGTRKSCEPGFPCEEYTVELNYTLKDLGVVATGLENGAQVMDVNGDGHEDIVFLTGSTIKAHINNGNGTFTANKTLYTFVDKVSSGYLNLGVISQTANMKSASGVDVNGDGRSDLVLKVTTDSSACYLGGRLITGVLSSSECIGDIGGQWKVNISTNHQLFVSTGTMQSPLLQQKQILGQYDDALRVADLNGDGLSDLLYVSSDKWWYRLSDGVQFLAAVDAGLATSSTKKYLEQFVDLNGDGRTDVLHATSTTNWYVYFSRPTNNPAKVYFEDRGSMAFASGSTVRFGDTTGDGKLNLLTSTGSTWIQYADRIGIKEYAINTITNGFGVKTNISYASMMDSTVYVTNASDADATTDTFSPHSGMQLVKRVETDSNDTTGSLSKASVNYQYGGVLVHKQGRGSLGFQMLRTIDNQTNVITETRYSQTYGADDYATAGMPVETLQTLNGVRMSYSINTLAVLTTANGGKWPYIASSEEENYIVDSTLNSTLGSVTTTSNEYDAWGNLLSSEISITDESTNDVQTTLNTNTYGSGDWERYGRLATSTVTKTRSGDPKTHIRESTFNYHADLMLSSSTLSPNQAATMLVTTYGYDTWGNKTSESVTGYSTATGSNITRTATSNYGSTGRYLKYTDDALGYRTSFLYNGVDADAVTGRITSIKTTDANGVAKTDNFDVWGQLSSTKHPDSKTTTVTQSYCSSCANNAYYFVRTTLTANPTQEVYYDRWGREVMSRVTSFSGGWNEVVKTYDGQGRPLLSYEPNSSSYSTIEYDVLGRPFQVTAANGAVTTTDLNGFEQRTTDDLGHVSRTFQNGFGETAYTEDELGNRVVFKYDAQGNVVSTVTEAEGGSYTTTMTYDDWGRKLTTNDPVKGLWIYTYNAFGELYTQKTARNHTFTFSYDKLGNKIRSYEASEGTLCWNFGTTSDKGRLLSTEKYEGLNATCLSGSPTYKQSYTYYSATGLPYTTTTLINGATYTQSQTYDSYSRPLVATYPTGTAAFAVKNIYNSYGYLSQVVNNSTSALLKRIDTMTSRGQVDKVTYGNNVTTSAVYDDETGWLSDMTVKNGSGVELVSSNIQYDTVGNVWQRKSKYSNSPGSNSNFTETYGYDELNRLTSRTFSNNGGSTTSIPTLFQQTQQFNYDDWGNITFKTGVGTYTYDVNKPYRLTHVHKDAAKTQQVYAFTYDNNGNVTNDGVRTFTYGSYDKATLISKLNTSSTMQYGPDRELVYKSDSLIENSKSVTYQTTYVGNYEKVYRTGGEGTLTEHKYYVGDIVYTQRSNATTDTFYLHKDNQGSVIATTNASGVMTTQAIYDPWGKRTAVYLTSAIANFTYGEPTDRGYTGHKEIKDLDIVHMGGRIYDSTLGRFLQADPFVQAPNDSQSYNRYAYVRNNPISLLDPSGYSWLSKTWKKWGKVIVAAVAVVVTYGAASGWVAGWGAAWGSAATATTSASLSWAGGAVAGAMAGFAGGYVATGSLKGALQGALSGAVFGGIGGAFNGSAYQDGLLHIGSHALAGGVLADLQGGNFGHGFWQAGLMKGVGIVNNAGDGASLNEIAGRATIQAMLGGTLSKVSGGKFANGAVTAAIQYLVNAQSNNIQNGWNSFKAEAGKLWGDFKNYWSVAAETEVNMYATASKNSMLKDLPDDQGVKAGGCAGFYFGGCAQLVVTNEGVIWSRGAGRVFGVSGGASYVFKNALATDGAVSWDTSISLGPVDAGYELNILPGSTPQFGYEASPVRFGLSINHTLMKHTYYRGD